ncbi:redoxin domain-containing protein [Elusimicrobiota bacterium]
MNRAVILLVFVSFFTVPIICADTTKNHENPEELIKMVQKKYMDSDTISVNMRSIMSLHSQGIENKISYGYNLSISFPSNFALINKDEVMGKSIVSNGKKTWIYQTAWNRYAEYDTNQKAVDALALDTGKIYSLGVEKFILPLFLKKEGNFISDKRFKLISFTEESSGANNYYIFTMSDDKTEFKIFIDRETMVITRIDMDIHNLLIENELDSKDESSLPSIKYSEIYENTTFNEKINSSVFSFEHGNSFEKVDNIYSTVDSVPDYPYIGEEMRYFKSSTLFGKNTIDLHKMKGKIVVLCFFDNSDKPTLYLLDALSILKKSYKAEDIEILTVSPASKKDSIRKIMRKYKIDLHSVLDKKNNITQLYGVNTFPTLFIIDKKSIIQHIYTGFFNGLADTIKSDLEDLLASKKVISGSAHGLVKGWSNPKKAVDIIASNNIYALGHSGKIHLVTGRGSIFNIIDTGLSIDKIIIADSNNGNNPSLIGYRKTGTDITAFDQENKRYWNTVMKNGINQVIAVNSSDTVKYAVALNGQPGIMILNSEGSVTNLNNEIYSIQTFDAADFNGDGISELAAVSSDGSISILNDKAVLQSVINPDFIVNYIKTILIKDRVQLIVSGSSGKYELLKLLDASGSVIWEVILGNTGVANVITVRKHPLENKIAVSTIDGQILLYDEIGNLIAHKEGVGMKTSIDWYLSDSGEYSLITASIENGINMYELKDVGNEY